ncbi:MAG: hypothetical protein MMC23_004703 [Stictis urceolatum]|nr:hypothetical protein [Stictis urceolata]
MKALYTPYGDALLGAFIATIGTFTLLRAHRHLLAVRTAARVTKEEKQEEIINQKTEDGENAQSNSDSTWSNAASTSCQARNPGRAPEKPKLRDPTSVRTSTLLLNPPLTSTRAIKIIVERAGRENNSDALLNSLFGGNPRAQARALSSLRFLMTSPIQHIFLSPPTPGLLIDYLASRLPDVRRRPHNPTDFLDRSEAEQNALICLLHVVKYRISDALVAGLVSSWLGQYPFSGPEASAAERVAMVQRLCIKDTDDLLLAHIVREVVEYPQGRREMRGAGLVRGNFSEDEEVGVVGEYMAEEEGDGAGVLFRRGSGILDARAREGLSVSLRGLMESLQRGLNRGSGGVERLGVGERVREESPEEVALRRRRRMAMVINEGGPLRQDNIIDGVDMLPLPLPPSWEDGWADADDWMIERT